MKKQKLIALLTVGCLSLTILGGCTQQTATPQAAETTATTAVDTETETSGEIETGSLAAETAEDTAGSATRTVTDMAGRTVVLPETIERIATFGSVGVLNAFVELMGDGDKICHDMPARFSKGDKWQMQYEFAPQMKGLPVLEDGDILIETVLEVNPDVCLVMNKESMELLEKNGLAVIYLEWKQDEDVKDAVSLMGEVLNKQETAAEYLDYFDRTLTEVQELTKDLPEDSRKKVLYTSLTDLTQPHEIAEWWIALAGGLSVTADSRELNDGKFTLEDVLEWNPDVMVVTADPQIEEARTDSRFSGITAIKDDSIYMTPTVAHVWGNRTVEQPLTIYWMMNKLYPDILPDNILADKIKDFYQQFFLYEMTDEQIDKIIH